jgi:serine/threonine protein kinase
MRICPSCRKPVDARLARCPWDGTLLGTVAMDPLLGSALGGRYLLRKCIGEREGLLLYTAEDTVAGGIVLATVIQPRSSEELGARFQELAAQAATVDHTGCTVVRDHGVAPGGRFFLIEEGDVWHQLDQELVLKGRLSVSKAVEFTINLVEALDHLHGRGVFQIEPTSAELRLVFDAQGALKLLVPLAAIVARTLSEGPSKAGAEGNAAMLRSASGNLLEMLVGARTDPATIDLRALNLDEDSAAKLRSIVERGLGRRTPAIQSAWELRRELETVTGSSRFGRYELLHRLAIGGMGELFLARAVGIEGLEINRMCVIKTVRANLLQSSEFVERFLAEARVLTSLSHGNIVPVYDVGKVGSVFYIAMEYVAGKDLRQVLSRAAKDHKRIPLPLALFIAKELANGLAYAHRAKVQGIGNLVHRDVSPHNALVSYEGEVKLIDFGLARGVHELASTSKEGVVMGKVCYLSPEQARAQPLDQRTDIYSAGLVLFELLTGEPFFNQPTIEEVLDHVATPDPETPSQRAPHAGITPEVDRICLHAIAPFREDRYRSAAALRDDLTAELARIAPRTNPEEVGAFVRALFSSEQKDEELLLSDLSSTLPPRALAEIASSSGAAPEGGGSEALSLLGRVPTPIQLAATIVSEDHAAGRAPALDPASLLVAAPAPARPTPGLAAGGPAASAGPMAFEPTLPSGQHEGFLPRPSSRIPLFALGGMVLAAAGLGIGIWLSRVRESNEAERAALRTIAGWKITTAAGLVTADASATLPPESFEPDAGAPGSRPRTKQRLKVTHKRSVSGPPPCLLSFVGGEGMELAVDGASVAGGLPQRRPLPLDPRRPHRVVVSKAGLTSFIKTITCEPGDELKLRVTLRKN